MIYYTKKKSQDVDNNQSGKVAKKDTDLITGLRKTTVLDRPHWWDEFKKIDKVKNDIQLRREYMRFKFQDR